LVLSAVGLILAVLTVAYWLNPSPEEAVLRTLALDRGPVRALITGTGTVRPMISTNISTQVSGQVSEVLIDFDDPVTKGQLLARLDPQTFLARVRESEAQLEVAKAELASRESALAKSQAQLRQHEARRGVAKSEAESARA